MQYSDVGTNDAKLNFSIIIGNGRFLFAPSVFSNVYLTPCDCRIRNVRLTI